MPCHSEELRLLALSFRGASAASGDEESAGPWWTPGPGLLSVHVLQSCRRVPLRAGAGRITAPIFFSYNLGLMYSIAYAKGVGFFAISSKALTKSPSLIFR